MKLIKEDILTEVRKEDDLYYQGAFWIKGDSVKDIKKGKFEIIGDKLACDFHGNYKELIKSKNSLTHKQSWDKYNSGYEDKEYNYLPRGRVGVYEGTAFIHLPTLFNQPDIIDMIIKIYNLEKLELEIHHTDSEGSHYNFELQ